MKNLEKILLIYTGYLLLGLFVFIALPQTIHAQKIAAGGEHTLAVCREGSLMAWGYNQQGQLGDGTATKKITPIQVPNISNIVAVANGTWFSIALKSDGSLMAWGHNTQGALGDGTTTTKFNPVPVPDISDVMVITAGTQHSIVLKNDGSVWAWGRNLEGQLGNGMTNNSSSPVRTLNLDNVIGIAGGNSHSLAVKRDGSVWIWGTFGDSLPVPILIPIQVPGLTNIVAVACSYGHNLALSSDGTIWAWGENMSGQLGDGTTQNRINPVPVFSLSSVIAISAGISHSMAMKNDGTVWAWGYNWEGQLGDGTNTSKLIPTQVLGINNAAAIDAGSYHSIALRKDGTLYAWGKNYNGQLGNNTTIGKNTPVQTINLCYVSLPDIEYYSHYVNGYLYGDANSDCVRQINEPGLSFSVLATPGNYHTFSNDTGYYSLGVFDSVNYTFTPNIPQRFSHMVKNPCPANYSISLDADAPKDTSGFDFGFQYSPCHQLRIGLISNRRRRCFRNVTSVFYTNEGLAGINGVEVFVKMPDLVMAISASMPYTWNNDSAMVFTIDTLGAGAFGYILIIDSVACIANIVGLTQCTQAWITPTNTCLITSTTGTGWDKSSLKVTGTCVSDTIWFVIYNTGNPGEGDMDGTSEYRIYADNVLNQTGTFQIKGGDSLIINVISGGATIRIEADQRTGHPGKSRPRATVETCGDNGTGSFSIGMVNQVPQDDEDLDVEIDCLPIRDSYDPNDKQVLPAGIGSKKIVFPKTALNFSIRFQNTGTDTAYKVIVTDTLSKHLDISTLELGTSSFPYSFKLSGEGKPVLTFTFSGINLTDTITNEQGSQGFVKFKISPYDTVALGTLLSNQADIFFDFNEPVRTNRVEVTIDTIFITAQKPKHKLSQKIVELYHYPNPFSDILNIEAKGKDIFTEIIVTNLLGVEIEKISKIEGKRFSFQTNQWVEGVYIVHILTKSKQKTVGKAVLIRP